MSPDPEDHSSVDELELVDFHDEPHYASSNGNGFRGGRLSRRGRAPSQDYHEAHNNEHDATSAITEDDLNSAEDEGLITGNDSVGGTIDDYFYYGFSNAEASVDWRCAFWLVISFLFITCMAIILPGKIRKPIVEPDGTVIFPNGTIEKGGKNESHFVYYECPAPDFTHGGENFHNTSVEESYINRTEFIKSNFSGFLETFHDLEFDGWGKTYSWVKQGMYHWKSSRFPKNLKDGDTIYESACGIGLNLVMTMEILQEVKGVNNIIVYGNEYIPSSANTSNKILDALLPQLNATRGSVCAADSTNLNFIPANSFDLVFTGKSLLIIEHLNKVRFKIASICFQLKSYKMSIVSSTIFPPQS